jgi:uncharacterized protein involved in exopolysaccharide biosynthesis/Mrp family chromosome partitioning ATPase
MRSPPALSDSLSVRDERGGELDLGAIGRALWARKFRILVPTLLALLVAIAIVQLITPRYKSTASVFLQSQESSFTRPTSDQQRTDQQAIDEQAVASQVQLLMSRDIARQVIARLDLAGRPEFDPFANGVGPLAQALIVFGLADDLVGKTPEDRALNHYYESLAIYPMDKSRVIAIEFASRDPDLAAQAANAIADAYIEAQRAAKRGDSVDATQALSPQIVELRDKVNKAEAAVEAFRARNGLFVSQNNSSLSTQQLGEINAQLSAARSQKTDAQAKAKLLTDLLRAGRPIETSDVTNNDLLRRLAEQRANLKAQLALELRTLLPAHPRVKELEAQLDSLETQIVSEARRTVRSLENDAVVAGARVESLTQQLEVQKGQAADANGQEVQLRALEREAKSERDLLETYLSRFREASARASFHEMPADARIVSRAIAATTPYFPKKLPIIIIAALAVLILSVALVSAGEVMSGRAYLAVTPEPPRTVGEPGAETARGRLTGIVERSAPEPVTDGPAEPHPPSTETPPHEGSMGGTQDIARLIARFRDDLGKARVLLFAGASRSTASSEGASLLARTLAESGMRVILVDLGEGERDTPFAGLGDLLIGDASFVDIIHRDRFSRLHLIPAGRGIAGGADAQTLTERLHIACGALATTYDAVVFDAGPVDADTHGRFWAPLVANCDACALVWRDEEDDVVEAGRRALSILGAREIIVARSDAVADRVAA